jgi:hypothetical protein
MRSDGIKRCRYFRRQRTQCSESRSELVVSYKVSGSYGNASGTFPVSVVGEQIWNGRPVYVLQGRSTLYFDLQGRQLARGNGSAILESGDPYWSGREWPLSAGRAWTSSPKVTNHSNGQTSAVEFTHTVQSAEEVTTPAGTFVTTYRACSPATSSGRCRMPRLARGVPSGLATPAVTAAQEPPGKKQSASSARATALVPPTVEQCARVRPAAIAVRSDGR